MGRRGGGGGGGLGGRGGEGGRVFNDTGPAHLNLMSYLSAALCPFVYHFGHSFVIHNNNIRTVYTCMHI